MAGDDKEEILQRLKTAFQKTKKLYEDNPIPRDLHQGTNISNHWPIITATYSGLEQTLKFLIANENCQPIQEFLNNKTNRIHDLSSLFGQLGNQTKKLLEDDYIQFQSLHWYIPIEDIGSFLAHVSGNDGKGYQLWRYSLIQYYNQPPVNSVEAMIAIWGTSIKICEHRINQNYELRLLAQEIQFILENHFPHPYSNISDFHQKDINLLYQRFGSPLNLFAKILRNFDRLETHGLTGVSEELSEAIDEWVKFVLEDHELNKDISLKLFLDRSTGKTNTGDSFGWDSKLGKFENVP